MYVNDVRKSSVFVFLCVAFFSRWGKGGEEEEWGKRRGTGKRGGMGVKGGEREGGGRRRDERGKLIEETEHNTHLENPVHVLSIKA